MEGEEKQATAYLPAEPMESFTVLWPWLVFQSSSLIGGLWKHLRVGHFLCLFFYQGVRMSSCDWSLAFFSAFWTVYHLKPLLFEFCSLYPDNPCLSQAFYSMLSLPLVILKREIPQICAISRNQHYPLIQFPHFNACLVYVRAVNGTESDFDNLLCICWGRVLGIEPGNVSVLGTLSITKLYFQPQLAPLQIFQSEGLI